MPASLGAPPEDTASSGPSALQIGLGVAAVAAVGLGVWAWNRKPSRPLTGAEVEFIESAHIDLPVAKAYSDVWSSDLKEAWTGKWPKRSTHIRGTKWLTLAELRRLLEAVCPQYNDFYADTVVEVFEGFGPGAYEYQLGREGSPVIYVRAGKRALKALRAVKAKLEAAEMDLEDQTMRIWWD